MPFSLCDAQAGKGKLLLAQHLERAEGKNRHLLDRSPAYGNQLLVQHAGRADERKGKTPPARSEDGESMKRKFQICIIMFVFCLAAGFVLNSTGVMAFEAADGSREQRTDSAAGRGQTTVFITADGGVEQTETSGNKEKKRGWVILENGARKYFDKNGKYVTGFKKIDGKTYSFNAHGRLQTDKWINYNGDKYHTDKKGVLIREKTAKIGDNTYYFNKKGILVRGKTVTINNNLYYFGSNGALVRDKAVTISNHIYYFGNNGALVRDKAVTINNNIYYFGSNGALVRDKLVTINNHVYYFGSNGVMYKGWKKDANGTSYFQSNGVRASGLTQIDGKYYYFDSNGFMKTGTFQEGGNTYYMTEDGVLEVWKTKNTYYDSSNKKMTTIQAEDFETLQRAKKIAAEITNSSMSQAQKLRKCFDWVKAKPYMTRRKFNNAPGWPALYANDHFIYVSGNCQSDAAAFAYLAKALGYTDVYVCADSTGWGLPHSWTEINGLVYDPLFAEAKGFSQNYGVRYGVYKLWPVVHIKL